ncbi:hypothetical protein TrST_g1207 [Triparma strigata]|uniref:Uncharacterized protein n=1 Tax=Triparma strigata TaxID=1606541 RepID=A0A9W7AU42_9STRA|nr:hypothetical protein TrST_g1207 [Triparma strigata]
MTLASVPEEDRKGVVATFSREGPKVPRWWIAVYKDPFRDWSSIDGSEVEAKWADVYYKKSCDEGCVFQHGGEMDPPGTWGKEDCAEGIRCLCSSGPTSDATFEWSRSLGLLDGGSAACASPPPWALDNFGAQFAVNALIVLVGVINLVVACVTGCLVKGSSRRTYIFADSDEEQGTQSGPKKPSKLKKDLTVASAVTTNLSQVEREDQGIPFVGLRWLLLYHVPRTSGFRFVQLVCTRVLRAVPSASFLWLASGYLDTGIPARVALNPFIICFVCNFVVTHTVISSLLRDNPGHVSEVLAPLADSEVNRKGFRVFWNKKEDEFRKWGKGAFVFGVLCFLLVISDARRIGDMKSGLFRAVGISGAAIYIVLTQNCFTALIEIFTAGHVAHIKEMKNHLIEALESRGEKDADLTNIKLDEVEANHKSVMKKSNNALQKGIYLVGVGYITILLTTLNLCYICFEELAKGVPPQFQVVLNFRAYAGLFLSCLYMQMFVELIREIAKVGEAYRELCCDCGTGSLMAHSARHFGDPGALRSRFDNPDKMKNHSWVLFSHAVDMTIVWATLISLGMALLLTVVSIL